MRPRFRGRPFRHGLLALGLATLVLAAAWGSSHSAVFAQGSKFQVQISKSCTGPVIVGQVLDCTITLTNADASTLPDGVTPAPNTYVVYCAFDVINGTTSVPANPCTSSPAPPGNFNTAPSLTVTACDASAATLPCTLAPGESVTFHENQYIVTSADATRGEVDDVANINVQDLCNVTTTNCSTRLVTETAPASTTVMRAPTCAAPVLITSGGLTTGVSVTVTAPGGVASLLFTTLNNATATSNPTGTPATVTTAGSTITLSGGPTSVTVTATKVNVNAPAALGFTATDAFGQSVHCDPPLAAGKSGGKGKH